MKFNYNDGGRKEAGYKGEAGDCVVRAIAIASGLPYAKVYSDLKEVNSIYANTHRDKIARKIGKKGSSPRNGNFRRVVHDYILGLGFEWRPTMGVGTGCTVHLREDELPKGTLIAKVSKHLAAVVDGTINDTHDCSREGTRCVYGYYLKKGGEIL